MSMKSVPYVNGKKFFKLLFICLIVIIILIQLKVQNVKGWIIQNYDWIINIALSYCYNLLNFILHLYSTEIELISHTLLHRNLKWIKSSPPILFIISIVRHFYLIAKLQIKSAIKSFAILWLIFAFKKYNLLDFLLNRRSFDKFTDNDFIANHNKVQILFRLINIFI